MTIVNFPLRDNAAARRRALVNAAAEVLAEQGLDAPFRVIAERASVSRNTLFRSFPNRTGLALAVLTQEVEDLADRTNSWAGEDDVFFRFLQELADLCVRHAGLADALRSAVPEALAPLRDTLVEVGAWALQDAQIEGRVREDVNADDILMIANLLSAGLSGDLAERRVVSLRTREIVLSGLRARQ
jgi:AcrR family transcriptional regulator